MSLFRRFVALLLVFALSLGLALAEPQVGLAPETVGRLEARLHDLGYLAAEADQVYDDDTRQALEVFQQANGLPVTGQVDAATAEKLNDATALSRTDYLQRFAQLYRDMTPLRLGDINSQVQVVQRLLAEYGYFSGTSDGVFGEGTRRAVERFQMVNGLPATGEADGATMMRLMAEVPIRWQAFLSEMTCAAGDVGLNVYVLQTRLDAMGYYDGERTGSFGDLTRQAVMDFQSENQLEPTGAADARVWELIYSGSAVARRRSDVAQRGDTGEAVTRIQERLRALGYLSHDADGTFDYATETALRLFQMGHALSATGRAGSETLAALFSEAAQPISAPEVLERFAALLAGRGASVQPVIAEIAAGMVGTAFDAPGDALYPGFALAQYVCVAAGLPITQPETLIRLADVPVESADEVAAGNIVAFQTSDSDSVSMLLTIGAGEGRVIYAVADVGWVVTGYVNQIDSISVYRWAEPSQ